MNSNILLHFREVQQIKVRNAELYELMRRSKRIQEKKDEKKKSNHPTIQKLLSPNPKFSLEKLTTFPNNTFSFENDSLQHCCHSGKFGDVIIIKTSMKQIGIESSSTFVSPLTSLKTPQKCDIDPSIFNLHEKNENQTTPMNMNMNMNQENNNNNNEENEGLYVAIKKTYIRTPNDINDMAYREVLIHKRLMKVFIDENYPSYIKLYKWYKTIEDERYYLNYILEKADLSLFDYIKNNFYVIEYKIYRNILFQMIFGIFIGQKKCEFVHHDLHNRNILLKMDDNNIQNVFKLYENNEWYCENILIKITDFGHSRVRLDDGKIIYNVKNTITHTFNPSTDILKIKDNLKIVSIKNIDEQQDILLKDLLKKFEGIMTTNDILKKLLTHEFFSGMKEKPKGDFLFYYFGKNDFYGNKNELNIDKTNKKGGRRNLDRKVKKKRKDNQNQISIQPSPKRRKR